MVKQPAQDKGVIVKAEIRSICESDRSNLWSLVGVGICDESHPDLLCRLLHDLPKVPEALY